MRRRQPDDDIDLYASKIEAGDSSDRPYQLNHDIAVAMASLSESERTAVLLFYYDDRPLKEVSKIMDMPEGTVKSHLSRAKTKMAKTLKEYKNEK